MKIRTLANKLLATMLSFAILLSCVVVSVTTATGGAAWDGAVAEAFSKGSGTAADPYIVSTPAELKLAVTSTGLNADGGQNYYKMTNSIYLNSVLSDDWKTASPNEWNAVSLNDSTAETAFKGNFNGDGYMVYGLYVSESYTAPEGTTADRSVAAGLFPTVGAGAVIKNVGIDAAHISLTNDHTTAAIAYAGQVGLIGYAYNSETSAITIDQCFIGTDVTLEGVFAGLVGDVASNSAASVVITNCYAVPTSVKTFNEPDETYIYNNRFMLGAGRENSAAYKLDYCFAVGGLTFTGSGSTDTKYNYCTQWTSSKLGTKISEANMKGSGAFDAMPGLNTKNAYALTETYPVLKIFDKTPANVWDGTTATPTAMDDNGNLIIGTAEELAYVIYNGGGSNYVLTSDIYLNDITAIDWSTGEAIYGYTPKEWYSTSDVKAHFSGNIDGNGHIVHGLYVNETINTSDLGDTGDALFPGFESGYIKNVGVDDSFIQATNNGAAIVGIAQGGTYRSIENCYAGANVTVKGYNAAGIYGGGDAMLDIISCYSLASVSGSYRQAGISGDWESSEYSGSETVHNITDCYTTDSKICYSATKCENCHSGASAKGDAAINDYTNLSAAFVRIGNTFPVLKSFTDLPENIPWNGFGDTSYIVDGKGDSADNPYIIETAGQLAHAIYNNGDSKYYKLANDIYLNDVSEGWLNREDNLVWLHSTANLKYGAGDTQFTGYIEGDGYTVQGIYLPVNNSAKTAALVPAMNGGSIKNLGIRNSQIISTTNSGGFVGGVGGSVMGKVFDSLFVDDTVLVKFTSIDESGSAGGVIGYMEKGSETIYSAISNCYSAATLVAGNTPKQRQNGIVGGSWNSYYTVTNCYSIGSKPYHASNTNTASKISNAYNNVYTDSTVEPSLGAYTRLSLDKMKGAKAFENMLNFSDDIWYAVQGDKTPMLRVYGIANGDVDENGTGKGSGDITALRTTLIGATNYKNTDFDRNGETNICDLVEMSINYRPIIIFDANGGNFTGSKTVITKEQTLGTAISAELPTLSGYGCVGWSLTPNGEAIDSNIVTAEMDGITLYAVWKDILIISPAFADNMVLQRNKPICVYGTGNGEGEITIGNQTKQVVSDNGSWEVYFEPMKASTTPVTFKTNFAGIETEYKNVLIGDVFIASGQSNMQFRISSTEQSGTVKANPLLRFKQTGANDWNEFTAENVERVTAIGVLFAQELSKALDNKIPVGIISESKGASRIEDWIHSDYCFCEEYDFDNTAHSDYTYYDQGHHSLYENQILPIEKMTTAGVLWYQGESNRGIGEAYRYLDMFKVFVDCWRTRMNDPTLPFYTVQIMLYTGDAGKDKNKNAVDEYNIRIAQGEAARTMDNITVCTMLSREDTKTSDGKLDIHPTDKLPVAKALANAALTTYYYPQGDYNETPEYSGPLYNEITVNGGTATVTFNHTAEGLMLTTGETVTELEVRNSDGNWIVATGTLANNAVTVTADGVTEITGVRMGYRNSPDINLFSTINGVYGYCASPFVWLAD